MDVEVTADDPNSANDVSVDKSEEKIHLLAQDLRSDSAKTVYKALHYLRTKILERPKGAVMAHECGATKAFYKILLTTNPDVLNSALSVLGQVSSLLISNESFCYEMIAFEASNKLASLLRKSTDKKVQRRICRLIGNMAQSHALGRDLIKVNVHAVINNLLSTSDCSEVKTVALRALRWLWSADKSQLVRIEAVKTVAGLLEVEDPKLFKLVVRTLVVFTQSRDARDSRIAHQIGGVSGLGYHQIVSKLNEPLINVLILNLSHSADARVELCKAGAVRELVDSLQSGKTDSYLITALCLMCQEPMVRANLRKTSDGFKTILALLVNPKTKHFYPDLVKAISQFNYDTPGLLLMVKGGLIGVLVEKLDEFSRHHGEPHSEPVAQMSAPMSPSAAGSSPSPSVSSRGSVSPTPQRSYSPPFPSDNTGMYSPGTYSPRCTTPELEDSSPPEPSSSSTSNKPPSWYNDSSSEMDSCILEVLCQLTYQGTPLPALASKTTITTFLRYMTGLKYPQSRHNFIKAAKALSSIVKCKNYFSMILEEESIVEIDKYLCRSLHNECWECRRLEQTGRCVLSELGTAAQSGLGEGELTYRLATSSENVRTNVSLVVSLVVEQPHLLKTLLFGHHALRLLLDAVRLRDEDAVSSLHCLFCVLGVENPQKTVQYCALCNVSGMRKESNISFQLDDGSIVLANKESLSHGSPMFEAMFRGGFVESKQSTVQITDISSSCLTHLTRVIDEYCECALPKDHKTLMEMVIASDRFLLPELSTKILSVVMNSALSHATCPDIFEWGLLTGQNVPLTEDVPLQVVRYILTADMPSSCRTQAVKTIVDGSSTDEFFALVTDIVSSSLRSYTKSYKYSCQMYNVR
ncbi:BTB/POZ domain [Nesidiocoris tenuis]|nr:BTB/POZ domain [Nesidiocoris tenuis]